MRRSSVPTSFNKNPARAKFGEQELSVVERFKREIVLDRGQSQAFETQRDDLRNAEGFPSRDVILNADGRMTCRLKFGANLVGTSHTHSAFAKTIALAFEGRSPTL